MPSKVVLSGNRNKYYVICKDGMVDKWKQNKSMSIDDVVCDKKIYASSGADPQDYEASYDNPDFRETFGSVKFEDAACKILEKGQQTSC
ncbi:hypothetical protein CU097_015893 [Rhizopus azygosporus]|uniref:Ribosome maturation protein SDO1/SBDS N-terminal domain-containing protein n=1 Tax=Rhizopus azygosporus TaxID=86630 RepID=A0A367KG99_RHIAZ|nr:hypothetical protein CU097_015893 [Rhizopus azygosporus]